MLIGGLRFMPKVDPLKKAVTFTPSDDPDDRHRVKQGALQFMPSDAVGRSAQTDAQNIDYLRNRHEVGEMGPVLPGSATEKLLRTGPGAFLWAQSQAADRKAHYDSLKFDDLVGQQATTGINARNSPSDVQKLGLILGARRVKPLGWLFNQNRSQNEIGRAVRELQAALGEVPTGLIGPGSPGYEKLLRSLDFSARHLPEADNDDHLRHLLKPAKGFDQLWEDWLPLAKQQSPREEKSTTGQIFTWTFDPVTAQRLEAERAKKLALTQEAERGLSDADSTAPLAGEQVAQVELSQQERPRGEAERLWRKEAAQLDQPTIPVPKQKAGLEGVTDNWSAWDEALQKSGVTGDARSALMQTFAWEGGLAKDGSTVAGITQSTLDRPNKDWQVLLRNAGIPAGTRSADLTNAQRVAFYKAYFDFDDGSLGRADGVGSAGLEKGNETRNQGGFDTLNQIGDPQVTAAVVDTLVRGGSEAVKPVIQASINNVLWHFPQIEVGEKKDGQWTIDEDRSYGPQTLQALQLIAADPKAKAMLLKEIRQQRLAFHPGHLGKLEKGDIERYRYFSFSDQPDYHHSHIPQ